MMNRSSSSESIVEDDFHSFSRNLPGTLRIPKRRSSLRNRCRATRSAFDLSDLGLSLGLSKPDQRPSLPKPSNLGPHDDERSIPTSTAKSSYSHVTTTIDAIFSPDSNSWTPETPETELTKAISVLSRKSTSDAFSTPTRRRAISQNAVFDTPPRSTDRFIPSRSRGGIPICNYRANKAPSHLSPSQMQMRLDGASSDPFVARRVTPRINVRRNTSGSRNHSLRIVSANAVWNIGGSAAQQNTNAAVHTGQGTVLESGTNARMFSSDFFKEETAQESHERFEARLAMALDLDRSGGILNFACRSGTKRTVPSITMTTWKDGQWELPHKWNKLLDAPALKDDYYCTLLAYCPIAKVLAVGLKNRLYLWSETKGVQNQPRSDPEGIRCYITSLCFSAPGAGKSILAMGRSDGRVNLWCVREKFDRIQHTLSAPIACLAFKPVFTTRFSARMRSVTSAEDLLVGDELGTVYYYTVEWAERGERTKPTSMVLLAKLSLHSQQVCGLAWSQDGEYFATGGNDNICYLFTGREALSGSMQDRRSTGTIQFPGMSPHAPEFVPNRAMHYTMGPHCSVYNSQSGLTDCTVLGKNSLSPGWDTIACNGPNQARHRWLHAAAVKAIAFCPWQKGLIATGGGSNDRAIHFFHISSGACLATINVYAQVTSLIWSKTKREICATFGYASPDHPYRIAVFSWPDCRQVVRIPWKEGMRALYAIPYPGGPNEENQTTRGRSKGKAWAKNSEGGVWWSRTKEEGCIVVACSDQSVKFHEVWSGHSSATGPRSGGLAWSSILESEEGGDIEFENEPVIR